MKFMEGSKDIVDTEYVVIGYLVVRFSYDECE